MRSEEKAEAKRVIFSVAAALFYPQDPESQVIARWEMEAELHDVDDYQSVYLDTGGLFLVTLAGERIIGTGAFRPLEPGVCELKRIWLLPHYHGRGLGYRMMRTLLEAARERGFHAARLSTDSGAQSRAVAFYHRFGFHDLPDYPEPDPDTIWMEMDLTGWK